LGEVWDRRDRRGGGGFFRWEAELGRRVPCEGRGWILGRHEGFFWDSEDGSVPLVFAKQGSSEKPLIIPKERGLWIVGEAAAAKEISW
jgi:hypothetical protein